MKFEDYVVHARRTANPDAIKGLEESCLTIGEEAGEVQGVLKKHLYHDHPLDRPKATEEIGDLMWALNDVVDRLGLDWADIFEYNVCKSRKRYPNGFSSEASINRNE